MSFGESARATLDDVAARAGVSRSTASRVLTGSSHVSPSAIAAVHAAVRDLAYVPDTAAQLLAARRLSRP